MVTDAGRGRDRELGDAAREVAVEPEVGGALDRRGGESSLVVGACRGCLLVVAVHRWQVGQAPGPETADRAARCP